MGRVSVLLLAAMSLLIGTSAAASDYVLIRKQVTVERPADRVWQQVGGWCAIAEWLKVACDTVSGTGDLGSVRRLNGVTLETMVARTDHSYTYWQTAGTMAAYGYHGTLAASAVGPRRTMLTYTLLYDQAAMPTDAVRASERARLGTRFTGALTAMKQLAEAGQ